MTIVTPCRAAAEGVSRRRTFRRLRFGLGVCAVEVALVNPERDASAGE